MQISNLPPPGNYLGAKIVALIMQMVPPVRGDGLVQAWAAWSALVPAYWDEFKFSKGFSAAESTLVLDYFRNAPAHVRSNAKTASLLWMLQKAVGEDNLVVLLQRIGYSAHGNLGDKRTPFEQARRRAILALLDLCALGTLFLRMGFILFYLFLPKPHQTHCIFFHSQPRLALRTCSSSVKRRRRPRPRISNVQPPRFFQAPPPPPRNSQPHRQPPLNRPKPPRSQLIASSSSTTRTTCS